jgi:16S rRNA (guanine527-N7)-methyltransferase
MRVLDTLSERNVARLRTYVALLDKWRKITNLISDRSFDEVWSRHIEDSIFLSKACPTARRWLDIGSGAGFPSIVLGVLLADHPEARIHCVESDSRKCAFLRTVAYELGIPVKVHNARAENITARDTGPIDAMTARAFSKIDHILELGKDYLSRDAVAVLQRGKTWVHEVETLDTKRYAINVNSGPGGGAILTIRERGKRP